MTWRRGVRLDPRRVSTDNKTSFGDPNADVAKKILIVDDDPVIRRVLNALLRSKNYETAFAVDAISGVTTARKENPDLIILDIGLPGGDGFLLMERFRNLASLACVPVVVLSGRDPLTNKEKALEAGAVAFLSKPPDSNELLATIRKALGESDESTREKVGSPV